MYNGLAGGIGQGLQSFVAAYQQALNYQLEKSKAASLTDYQQKMAQAAEEQAQGAQANAAAGLIEKGGSQALEQYGGGLNLKAIPSDAPDDNSPATPPTPPAQGLVNPLPPGMVGPQPSPGMIAASQAQAQASQPQVPPKLTKQPILPSWQRQFLMTQKAKVDELNAEAQKSGSGQAWEQDPNTGAPKLVSQGALTGNAAVARQKDLATIASEISGSRGPKNTIAGDFQSAAKPFEESQKYTEQALANWNHRSPAGDAATALTAFRIKFPNAPDVNSLEELKNSPALPDQWRNEFAKAGTGLFSDDFMKQLMQDIIVTNDANYKTFKGVQKDYVGRAKGSEVSDTSFLNKNAIEDTHTSSDALLGKLGEYKSPNQRPNPGLLDRATGFLTHPIDSVKGMLGSGSSPQMPQKVTQGGHTYVLNPKTGKYE